MDDRNVCISKYEKPALERFGGFRELTLLGMLGVGDGGSMLCAAPCEADVAGVREGS
jgi:hypothetical protein